MDSFFMIFLSLFLEGLPFILIGALFSSFVRVYVSEAALLRAIPKNKFLGVLAASCVGIVFPVCECAIVPIFARLVKKGMPVYLAVTILLSTPLINPIVFLSSYYAFTNSMGYVAFRFFFGALILISIGFLTPSHIRGEDILLSKRPADEKTQDIHDKMPKPFLAFQYAIREFFDITRFFMLGAVLASVFVVYLPRELVLVFGSSWILSILFMMSFTYLTSICSEIDAFIARSFVGYVSPGSIVSFLTFGPMIDLKSTLIHFNYFKRKFVIALLAVLALSNFLVGLIVDSLLWVGGVTI
jgi:uncharacterized protein